MNTRWKLSLTAAVVSILLVACQGVGQCAEVDCAAPSIVVDLSRLPASLRRGVDLIGCLGTTCRKQPVGSEAVPGEGVLSAMLIALPQGSYGAKTTSGRIEVRVERAGRAVFRAATRDHLPIWHKKTRCPDCKTGNAFAVVEPNGAIGSRSPF